MLLINEGMMRNRHPLVQVVSAGFMALFCFSPCWSQSTVVTLENGHSFIGKGQRELVSHNIPPQVQNIEALLDQSIPANLLGRLAVRELMNEIGGLGVAVVLDESARENNLDENTLVHMTLGGQSIATNLHYALRPYQVEYQIDAQGVLVIRSEDSMLDHLTEVIYDVSSFTASPEEIAEVIQEVIDPDAWENMGGTARMQIYYTGGRRLLVISNTYHNQQKIRRHIDSVARMSGATGVVASIDDGGMLLSGSTVIAMPGDRELARRRGGDPGGFGGGLGGGFGGRGGSGLGGGVF